MLGKISILFCYTLDILHVSSYCPIPKAYPLPEVKSSSLLEKVLNLKLAISPQSYFLPCFYRPTVVSCPYKSQKNCFTLEEGLLSAEGRTDEDGLP